MKELLKRCREWIDETREYYAGGLSEQGIINEAQLLSDLDAELAKEEYPLMQLDSATGKVTLVAKEEKVNGEQGTE